MNIIVVGVGGQGAIFTSKLLTQCALESNLKVKTAEVFGMAQRGGSVTSEIRIGDEVISPMIPEKSVDLLIGFEMIETARYLDRVKKTGTVVTNDFFIRPYTTKNARVNEKKVREYIKNNTNHLITLNGTEIAKNLGNVRVLNTVLVGACSSLNLLPFTSKDIENAMKTILPRRHIDINLKAFNEGLKENFSDK
ncbi:MAG: hypothetical protein FH761_11110 [Firmicutes bacterium]|nr:hypothetical protein [Bacillota bacterium]